MIKNKNFKKNIAICIVVLGLWGSAVSQVATSQVDSSSIVTKQSTVKKSNELTNTNPAKSTNWSKIKDLFL